MRSIKFRQFICGKFHYWGLIDGDFIGVDSLKITNEQFIGLRDKNGIQIYEGDILQFKTKYMDKPEFRGQIKFNVSIGSYTFTKSNEENVYGLAIQDTFYNGAFNSRDLEITGNIHENPELLNNKEAQR